MLLWPFAIAADPIITFFFHKYPTHEQAFMMNEKMKKPHTIAKRSLEGILHYTPIAGIFSTYFGFLNVSDFNGQTVFPRKQSKTILNLVITNKIIPVIMFKYTVSHWELVPGVNAEMYRCEQKEDEKTQLTFWQVDKVPLPKNNYISPQDSIIIIANPNNIFIPTGITVTKPGANLMLPPFYVKKGIQTTHNALYMLDLTFFFRPVDLLYKKEKTNYETLVNE